MTFLLKRTARAEKIKLDNQVYNRICELANGGSRKALKLLGKVLYLDSDEERMDALKSDDSSENPETIELCRLLASKGANFAKASKILRTMDLSEPEKVDHPPKIAGRYTCHFSQIYHIFGMIFKKLQKKLKNLLTQ